MSKVILLTGATDGIGLETAKLLVAEGHHVLLHGRNGTKLQAVSDQLSALPGAGQVESFVADLARLARVDALADAVEDRVDHLDVLINNAGVFGVAEKVTEDGLDVRFAVNTLAPFHLARRLSTRLGISGRVINLSSAAQAPVDLRALAGEAELTDGEAYAQSKLALTMWSRQLGLARGAEDPVHIAVNPGSLLGSKMVKEAFGTAGKDLGIGADILRRAALEPEFEQASGQYFDNDAGHFGPPHPDALDDAKCAEVAQAVERLVDQILAG